MVYDAQNGSRHPLEPALSLKNGFSMCGRRGQGVAQLLCKPDKPETTQNPVLRLKSVISDVLWWVIRLLGVIGGGPRPKLSEIRRGKVSEVLTDLFSQELLLHAPVKELGVRLTWLESHRGAIMCGNQKMVPLKVSCWGPSHFKCP